MCLPLCLLVALFIYRSCPPKRYYQDSNDGVLGPPEGAIGNQHPPASPGVKRTCLSQYQNHTLVIKICCIKLIT